MKSTVTASFPDCVTSAHRLAQKTFIHLCKNNPFIIVIGIILKKFITHFKKIT